MKDIKQCVYKYVYEGSIIYVGKTDVSLKQRIKGHEKEDKFAEYLKGVKIYFIKLKNKAETSFMEKYLINKYKPILNVIDVYDSDSKISLEEPVWIEFSKHAINTLLDNKYTASLDSKLSNNINRYGLMTKFTVEELVNNYEAIREKLADIFGNQFSSSWFYACGRSGKESIAFCGDLFDECDGLDYFLEIDGEESIRVTEKEIKNRYYDTLFISKLAVYDDVENNKGVKSRAFNNDVYEAEYKKSLLMLTK